MIYNIYMYVCTIRIQYVRNAVSSALVVELRVFFSAFSRKLVAARVSGVAGDIFTLDFPPDELPISLGPRDLLVPINFCTIHLTPVDFDIPLRTMCGYYCVLLLF